jgi:hydroxyacylglutathione hydrolase
VLDVRTPHEWQQRHIPGSVNIPLNKLASRLDELPREQPIVVHCAGGYRSSIAGSLLQQAGFGGVSELTGGLGGWPG